MEIIKVTNDNQIEETVALAEVIWNEYYPAITGQEQVDYMLANFQSVAAIKEQIKSGYEYYLVPGDGGYVAYFAIEPKPTDNQLFLSKLYVQKEYRGHSIAKRSLQFIEARATELCLNSIYLTVNKNNSLAIESYEKLGFSKIKAFVNDIGGGFVMDDYGMEKKLSQTVTDEESIREIYIAGGCFWGVEKYFKLIPGVVSTTVGYANGNTVNPTYQDVCYRNTGHAEAVHVKYDSAKITLRELLDKFFVIIDPTAVNRQGNDIGAQYRTGIYYIDAGDKPIIADALQDLQEDYSAPIAVEFGPLENYYLAEEYHQNYLEKNPAGYCHIPESLYEKARN